jgi:hypothetical protein
MTTFGPPSDPTVIRQVAQRARELAKGLSQAADRIRLDAYADELDRRAAELERHGPLHVASVTAPPKKKSNAEPASAPEPAKEDEVVKK